MHSAARPTGWLRKGSWHTIRGGTASSGVEPAVASVLAESTDRSDLSRLRWWPWPKRERSIVLEGHRVLEGRACSDEHGRVAVLTPYFPYPLAHGGAVRICHLVRQMAEEFDEELFAFQDKSVPPETAPVLEFCARVVLMEKPRCREPRWSTLLPPDVCEFRSSARAPRIWRRSGEGSASTFCRWNVRNWRRTEATCWSSTTSPSICLAR